MIYLNNFDAHTSYEEKLNVGGIDFKIPNVSYCKDVKDVHFNPYNLIKFYVGEITGTTPQTVSIYTDISTSIPIQVNEGNKWYSYLLPKNKGLHSIKSGVFNPNVGWTNGIVKKVVIKANISYNYDADNNTYNGIVPFEITEVSFKGSNTSNVTSMGYMFNKCSGLTSLDVSGFDTSNVTNMYYMFENCNSLKSLDLSSFNTSKVTNMYYMFQNCNSLKSLDLSSFNTSDVTDMSSMFSECSSLEYLDLSGWDTSNVTDMASMFQGCSKLDTIKMIGCSPETVGKIKTRLKIDGLSENIVKTE